MGEAEKNVTLPACKQAMIDSQKYHSGFSAALVTIILLFSVKKALTDS